MRTLSVILATDTETALLATLRVFSGFVHDVLYPRCPGLSRSDCCFFYSELRDQRPSILERHLENPLSLRYSSVDPVFVIRLAALENHHYNPLAGCAPSENLSHLVCFVSHDLPRIDPQQDQ